MRFIVTTLRGKIVITLPEPTDKLELTPQAARRLVTAVAQRLVGLDKKRGRKRKR